MPEADTYAPLGLHVNPDGTVATPNLTAYPLGKMAGASNGPGGAFQVIEYLSGGVGPIQIPTRQGVPTIVQLSMTGIGAYFGSGPLTMNMWRARIRRVLGGATVFMGFDFGMVFSTAAHHELLPTTYLPFMGDGFTVEIDVQAVSSLSDLDADDTATIGVFEFPQ